MGGLVSAALGGLVAGAGQGLSTVGAQAYNDQNMERKNQLDTEREGYLQQLRNQGSESVANIGAGATIGAAQIGAGAHITAANIGADASRDVSNTQAQTARDVEATRSETTLKATGMTTGATIKAAQIHADMYRDIARNVNTDNDGNMFVLQNGKPQYLTDPDGDPIKAKNDITPGKKLLVDGWQKQLNLLTQDMNDPAKGMLIRNDPKVKAQYQSQIDQLQRNIYTTLGLEPGDIAQLMPQQAASGNRPPLSSFLGGQ